MASLDTMQSVYRFSYQRRFSRFGCFWGIFQDSFHFLTSTRKTTYSRCFDMRIYKESEAKWMKETGGLQATEVSTWQKRERGRSKRRRETDKGQVLLEKEEVWQTHHKFLMALFISQLLEELFSFLRLVDCTHARTRAHTLKPSLWFECNREQEGKQKKEKERSWLPLAGCSAQRCLNRRRKKQAELYNHSCWFHFWNKGFVSCFSFFKVCL